MDKLEGKTLVFTDIHFGLKQNAISRLNICVKVVKTILERIKKDKIANVIFAGDLYHERVAVNVNTLNVALKCIGTIAKYCNTYLIVGNHDAHYKNSIEVNSLNMFKDMSNVHIVDTTTELLLNGKKILLCPWLADLSKYEYETYDMMFGHFDISAKYLIASYIEDNSKTIEATSDLSSTILDSTLLNSSSVAISTTNSDISSVIQNKSKSNELIGDFIQLVKKTGTIFSGHIHQHREFVAKQRKFIFVGTPYEQTRGDRGNDCGYYVLDENNKYEFTKIDNTPIHIELRMSKILEKGIDKFDFSMVKGNIIHKIYDVDVDRISDSKITQKIIDFKPYDELTPDYDVNISYGNDITLQNDSIELIKKSKLEYIKNYIDNIDEQVLKEQELDVRLLYKTLEDYYTKIIEGQ